MKVKRLTLTAKLPTKANPGDLGYDLYADESTRVGFGCSVWVSIGIAIEFPDHFGGVIKDRSSAASSGLVTHAGVIDNGYRGEIKVLLHNISSGMNFIGKGQKIAQLILTRIYEEAIEEVVQLSETVRGDKGFGSSGS